MQTLHPTGGTLAHLLSYLRQLPSAGADAFLIVAVQAAKDACVNVTWSEDGFGVDYPLTTPDQLASEPAVRAACAAVGYQLDELEIGNGAKALDCYLSDDPQAAAVVIAAILRTAHGATDHTELEYSGEGLKALP